MLIERSRKTLFQNYMFASELWALWSTMLFSYLCSASKRGKGKKTRGTHFPESHYVTRWWKVPPSELSWMSSVISLLEFLLSPRGKWLTDWCKFLPEPPHVPSMCILQRTDTVSAPRYFILRPWKAVDRWGKERWSRASVCLGGRGIWFQEMWAFVCRPK